MIRESLEVESKNCNDDVSFKTMIILAIATSIDAFAVGVTFAFFKVKLFLAVIMIGIITFILSILGVKIGNKYLYLGGIAILKTVGFRKQNSLQKRVLSNNRKFLP